MTCFGSGILMCFRRCVLTGHVRALQARKQGVVTSSFLGTQLIECNRRRGLQPPTAMVDSCQGGLALHRKGASRRVSVVLSCVVLR